MRISFLLKRTTTHIFWYTNCTCGQCFWNRKSIICLFSTLATKWHFPNTNHLFRSKCYFREKGDTKSHGLNGNGYWGQKKIHWLLHINISNSYSNIAIGLGETCGHLVPKATGPLNGLLPFWFLGWLLKSILLCPKLLFQQYVSNVWRNQMTKYLCSLLWANRTSKIQCLYWQNSYSNREESYVSK